MEKLLSGSHINGSIPKYWDSFATEIIGERLLGLGVVKEPRLEFMI
jgi:hypothetical protein